MQNGVVYMDLEADYKSNSHNKHAFNLLTTVYRIEDQFSVRTFLKS